MQSNNTKIQNNEPDHKIVGLEGANKGCTWGGISSI